MKNAIYTELLNQMHILIAGAAGSGKSVVINGIIEEALSGETIDHRFILIDPKRVELVEYKGLLQTIKYASEPDEMVEALELAMAECDARYIEMQAERQKKYTGSHIWVIIDELADLMTTDGKRVRPLIQRLCQIGRAARIHVIAATQCPLANIIPTEIKVNFDCKVALRTASAQHSRNIMECTGCEKLPRYGKAYIVTPEGTELVTIPAPDDAAHEAIVAGWQARADAAHAARAAAEKRVQEAHRATQEAATKAHKEAAKEAPAKPAKAGFFKRLFA